MLTGTRRAVSQFFTASHSRPSQMSLTPRALFIYMDKGIQLRIELFDSR